MKKINSYLLFIVCSMLFACAGTDNTEQKPLKELYAEAYENIDDSNYIEAANKFIEIEASYPSDKNAPNALMNAAYAQYESENFIDALTTIDRFMRFHPGHVNAPYILYLKGMCFYRQVSDVRRDPGMSSYALSAFEQLVQRFPNSSYAKNAKNKIVILKNYIAGKIMYSARRNMKRKNYPVVITNLQKIILTMQETQMIPEALFRLTEAYKAIGLSEQANSYAAMLKKNFPDNEWSKKL